MKKVEAIISLSAFELVRSALTRRGVEALTVSELYGPACPAGLVGSYRGVQYRIDWTRRLRLEIVVSDVQATPIAYTIIAAARIGRDADGIVSVMPVEEAIRIRTGERGIAAIGDEPATPPLARRPAPQYAVAGARR